ncbi:MAG: hypothetical protein QOG14_332 [Mycobacterium sp.]|jgi:hypothetical protein|nr:hypothetical protein [Mycobacterium sp.]
MPTEPPPPPARPGSDAAPAPIADARDRFAPPDEPASEAEREAFARSKLEIARTDPRRSPAEREAAAAELERRFESPHPPDGGPPVS